MQLLKELLSFKVLDELLNTAPQQGVFKRMMELLMMLVSAFLVIFAWDTANKTQEESVCTAEESTGGATGQVGDQVRGMPAHCS